MRTRSLKWILLATSLVVIGSSFGQTKKRPATKKPATTTGYSAYGSQNTTGNKKDTTAKPGGGGSAYGNTGAVSGAAFDTTLPITVIKSSSGGLLDSTKMSLRNDAGIEQNLIKEKSPLPYENIREDDAVYRVRVWREIDAREKMNQPFRYAADEDNGNQRFISILVRAIKNGDITAFDGVDDRFTTPITPDAAIAAFGSGFDTVKSYNREGEIAGYQIREKAVDPDSIYKFRIKEEWIFDKESSRLFVRILGIAPVIGRKLSNGDPIPNSEGPVWWLYYPDIRPLLAKSEVFNPKNFGARMSWEELFESRMFSSYIIKSTFDNPYDLPLASVYPNSTLFRLLEGERIKEKIFNYEQSLWQY
ncbi:MAG: gliding motility protein GldN [Panacibacter sp.]